LVDSIVAPIAAWIVSVISAAGYLGVAGLMALESACVPLPSEVIMPFAGYLASTGRFNLVLAATAGAVGCNIGSTLAYMLAARAGRAGIERWGRYLLVSPEDLDRADRFFRRFGDIAILVGRLLPVVHTFIAVPAGIARMPWLPFQIYTFVGSWPWCYGLAYVGYRLGENWEADPQLRAIMHKFDFAIVAILLLGVAWLAWRHVHRWRRP
jgi:membrane protein DedA with SNARE-associated domain